MVPDADFTSYYGRPVLKASPWSADIPAYLFTGGLAGGSALLAAGADLTRRPALRRAGRFGALGGLFVSFALLVHDLGRPSRFVNMLRVAKPTSPMSVGTWILTAFAGPVSLAAAAEVAPVLPRRWRAVVRLADRPAGLAAAAIAPAVMSYTAVLVSDTATPSWHEGYREMPFVFVGSSLLASGGLGMLAAPVEQAGPARKAALAGAVLELAAEHRMEQSMGIAAEPLHDGTAGRYLTLSKALTVLGAAGTLVGSRNRVVAGVSGATLLVSSALSRFGLFHAGQQSALDPKYTVVPQRERLERRAETRTV